MRRAERAPLDAGLQPERTELAWRRTLLAMAVGSLAAARLLRPLLGDWAMVAGGCGLVFTATIAVCSRHRFARMHAWFEHRRDAPESEAPPAQLGGRVLLAVSVIIGAAAALALVQIAVTA
jgi:hypothetical protein